MTTPMFLEFSIEGRWSGRASRDQLWPEVERALRLMFPWVHDATIVNITRTDGLTDHHAPGDYRITMRNSKTISLTLA